MGCIGNTSTSEYAIYLPRLTSVYIDGLTSVTAGYTGLAGQAIFLASSTLRPEDLKIARNIKKNLMPLSDGVLHMSRIEFRELSSCEVWLLNQFQNC